ncbi:hypothetical protein C2845_PM03G34990 [Panicum miliaceum]|uniref:Ubiquitin-like protease family profile domain-containing protein n=1 Tax=Panicum miliaceum TaxID=4540 RepID=A0A3L6T911_PANMI|nr:hypothetical protein C2845_PM03G34990 [Panicum miliaceum]
MAGKLGSIPCSVEKFFHVIGALCNIKRNKIEELGLGCMLEIKSVKMRKSLLKCLIDYYDPNEDKVKFGTGDSFTISSNDVELIMGLPNRGTRVHLNENIAADDVPNEFKKNYNRDGLFIDDMVDILYCSVTPDDTFVRSFMLLLLGTILAPVSRGRIPIFYYTLVQDTSRIVEKIWNAFTLAFLKENLATLKKDTTFRRDFYDIHYGRASRTQEFIANEDTSESESLLARDDDQLNYSDEHTSNSDVPKEDSGKSVAATVKKNRRKKITPIKYKSPLLSVKIGKRNAQPTGHTGSNKKAKQSSGIGRHDAAIQYVNANYSSKEFATKPIFKHKSLGIPAKDMTCLTLPPGIKDVDKFVACNIIDAYTSIMLQPRVRDSRFLCPAHYSWMASDYDAERYNSPASQRVLNDLATTLFGYDKINGIASLANTIPNAPQDVGSCGIRQKTNLPKQTDGCSCGLYIIKYMELWNGSRLVRKFTQADINNFRREMAADLIFDEANEVQDVKEAIKALVNREEDDDGDSPTI